MRKIWWKAFLLCVACLVCVGGLCAAKDKENMTLMWQDEHINDKLGEKYKYYLDDSETKIIDYEGRKYLQTYFQRNKVFMEQIWFVPMWRESEKAHWTRIYDVERQKVFTLDYLNKDRKQKEGHYSISSMKQNLRDYSDLDKKFMQWMETNRKSLLDEIRRANGGNPSASGAAGQPAGSADARGEAIHFRAYEQAWYNLLPKPWRTDEFALVKTSYDLANFGFPRYGEDGEKIDYSAPSEFRILIYDNERKSWGWRDSCDSVDYDRETQTLSVWETVYSNDDWTLGYSLRFDGPDTIIITALRDSGWLSDNGSTELWYDVRVHEGDQFICRKGAHDVYWMEGHSPDNPTLVGSVNPGYAYPYLVEALRILIERNGNI